MLVKLMVARGTSKGAGFRRRVALLAVLGVAVCCAVLPTVAMAAAKPEVGYLSVSDVSTTGATIEVPINPEGGETSWEIWLECQDVQGSKQSCEPLTAGPQRQEGVLSPGFEPRIVTDAVSDLQPGYEYEYGVIATNSAGREGYLGDGFLTCPSQGSCPNQPYMRGLSQGRCDTRGQRSASHRRTGS
jgi:hypothetical protein